MAPKIPFALFINESAALPTIPFSSVGVNVGTVADEGVTTASLGGALAVGDANNGDGDALIPEEEGCDDEVGPVSADSGGGETALEVKGLLIPIMGEFDGVGLVVW